MLRLVHISHHKLVFKYHKLVFRYHKIGFKYHKIVFKYHKIVPQKLLRWHKERCHKMLRLVHIRYRKLVFKYHKIVYKYHKIVFKYHKIVFTYHKILYIDIAKLVGVQTQLALWFGKSSSQKVLVLPPPSNCPGHVR